MSNAYEGYYARFAALSKDDAAIIVGADTIVGDEFEVFFQVEDGISIAYLKNKFDATIGKFDRDVSRKLQLAEAGERVVRAYLSFVAYSEEPEPGQYWGEVAIITFNPIDEEVFEPYLEGISEKLAAGVRPNIDLTGAEVARLYNNEGWLPTATVPKPTMEKGSAVVKDHRTLSEGVVEQGRKGNPGCYAVSTVLNLLMIAVVLYVVLKVAGVL